MAPKKRNAYYYFMLDYLEKEKRRGKIFPNGISDVAFLAAPAWEKLSKDDRAKYNKRCQDNKANVNHQKLACNNIPIVNIEAFQKQMDFEENQMQLHIDKILDDAVSNNYLDELEFNVITFNYFSKTNNSYTPAEIGLSKFNLTEGITKQFHRFINPQKLPLGMAYTAKNYSETTHKIVPPPNCIGDVFSQRLYEQILEFLTRNDGAAFLPPLYTLNTHVPIVQSIMQQLCEISNVDYSIFKIYPLCELFFRLKKQTAQFNSKDNTLFNSIFLARALLDRDIYDYTTNISCDYHEEIDCSKYCSLSMVTRWSYFIMNHCSTDLNIKLVEGKHVPHNQCTVTVKENNETESDRNNYTSDDETAENEFIYDMSENISMVSAATSMLTDPRITKELASGASNRKIECTRLNESIVDSPITNFLMTINNDTITRPNSWSRNLVPPRLPRNSTINTEENFPTLMESANIKNTRSSKNNAINESSSDSSTSSSSLNHWLSFNKYTK